jgi:hypothetical protein
VPGAVKKCMKKLKYNKVPRFEVVPVSKTCCERKEYEELVHDGTEVAVGACITAYAVYKTVGTCGGGGGGGGGAAFLTFGKREGIGAGVPVCLTVY